MLALPSWTNRHPHVALVYSCTQVFGLEAASASSADVRRQYKRLAAVVHPDKCRLVGAADAFKHLHAAADRLLQSLQEGEGKHGPDGSSGHGSSPGSKRARTDHTGAEAWMNGSTSVNWDDAIDDDWLEDGGGFPWWDEWDAYEPARPAGAEAGGHAAVAEEAGTERRSDGQQAGGGQEGESQAAVQSGTARRQEWEVEQARLLGMGLEELRAEVRRRQDCLMEPQVDAAGQPLPLPQLQAELRQARSILADRVQAMAAERAATAGGGFF